MEQERDILISRIIDGEASVEQWQSFRTMADSDRTVWNDLAEAQADHESLSIAVDRATAIADDVDLPEPIDPLQPRLRLIATWGGWAAAAMLMVAWFVRPPAPGPASGPGIEAGIGSGVVGNSDEALTNYLNRGREEGRVVGVMPERVVLETRPLVDGSGVEVRYLLQILEREIISDVYRLTEDELGNNVAVPARVTPRKAPM